MVVESVVWCVYSLGKGFVGLYYGFNLFSIRFVNGFELVFSLFLGLL